MATDDTPSGPDALRFRDRDGQLTTVTETVDLVGGYEASFTFEPVPRGDLNEFDRITDDPDRPEDFDAFNRAAERYIFSRYFPNFRDSDVEPPDYVSDSVRERVDGWAPEDWDDKMLQSDINQVLAAWFRASGIDLFADLLAGDRDDTLDQVQRLLDDAGN